MRTGYQQEDFSWSIAGTFDGKDVNILSELIWQNLGGPHVGLDFKWNAWKSLVLKTSITRTIIASGTVRDSDYADNNRINRVYNELFDSDEGYVSTMELLCRYQFFEKRIFALTPYAGYAENRQSLYLLERDGNAPGLRSTYGTCWKGVVLGIHSNIKISESVSIHPHSKYFQLNYKSQANWNLIEEFAHPVSFKHVAKGFCFGTDIKLRYSLSELWSFFLEGRYTYWSTGKGVDKLYRKDGQINYTQLNGVTRNGMGISVGTSLFF